MEAPILFNFDFSLDIGNFDFFFEVWLLMASDLLSLLTGSHYHGNLK